MSALSRLVSFADYRDAARHRLPRILFDYIDGGSYNEVTLKRNAGAFEEMSLDQRVMIDVSDVQSETHLFGQSLRAPFILAPVGFSGMYAKRGEVQAAKAAAQAGIPFCLSTVGICSIEEVTEQSGTPPWFQLYMIKDRAYLKTLLQRAEAAGCPVLILTADLQTPGARYRDARSGMMRKLSFIEHIERGLEGLRKHQWLRDVYLGGRPHTFGNLDGALPHAASFDEAWAWIAANFDPSVTWDDLDFIRTHWSGPIVLKGVMTSQDAKRAVEHQLQGLIVSNHGGRQLDSAPASLDVLPEIIRTVDNAMPVLVDGGVRHGIDVVKAHKLGASGVLAGRAWAFALAAGGQAGVNQWLTQMLAEIRTAQILSATKRLDGQGPVQELT